MIEKSCLIALSKRKPPDRSKRENYGNLMDLITDIMTESGSFLIQSDKIGKSGGSNIKIDVFIRAPDPESGAQNCFSWIDGAFLRSFFRKDVC